jgi:AcrR family transcriptional regulator
MNKRKDEIVTVSQRGPRDERGVLSERVLDVARSLFATRGFAATSLRMVADGAGVDVALISYYFTNKAGLLAAALQLPADFAAGVEAASVAPIDQRGEAILDTHLRAWDDPRMANVMRALLLTAAHEPAAMELARAIYSKRLIAAISTNLSDEERELRAGLVASQMIGVAMLRYVWQVGAIAEIPSIRVKQLIAPIIQGYLTGPLQ